MYQNIHFQSSKEKKDGLFLCSESKKFKTPTQFCAESYGALTAVNVTDKSRVGVIHLRR